MGVTYSQFQLQTCIPGYYGGRPTCRNSQCRIQGPRLTQVFYLSNYLSIYLFIYLYIYLYIYLFIYLSVFLSIYLSIYLVQRKGIPTGTRSCDQMIILLKQVFSLLVNLRLINSFLEEINYRFLLFIYFACLFVCLFTDAQNYKIEFPLIFDSRKILKNP